jgi:hypothetical protein
MNKPYRHLKDAPVTVKSDEGSYTFICTGTRRGSGKDKYMVNIIGLGEKEEIKGKQLQFEFNGQNYGAVIEEVWHHGEHQKVDLGTIVSDPEFWK